MLRQTDTKRHTEVVMKKPKNMIASADYSEGYYDACDDWEELLPTEDELVQIILKAQLKHQTLTGAKTIAHAIAKRLGRE